jgi:hypothetical protein
MACASVSLRLSPAPQRRPAPLPDSRARIPTAPASARPPPRSQRWAPTHALLKPFEKPFEGLVNTVKEQLSRRLDSQEQAHEKEAPGPVSWLSSSGGSGGGGGDALLSKLRTYPCFPNWVPQLCLGVQDRAAL